MTADQQNQLDKIASVVCAKTGVSIEQIMSREKTAEVSFARQTIWTITRELLGPRITLRELGHHIGSRDHATVTAAIKTVTGYRETDRHFRALYDDLLKASIRAASIQQHKQPSQIVAERLADVLQCRNPVNMRIGIREVISTLKTAGM